MRDYRDAKAIARTLRAALAAKGIKISVGESLELTSKALGAADWNTLAALIRAGAATPVKDPEPAPPAAPIRTGLRFASALEATLHRAVAAAAKRKHQHATVEHLLLALADDPDAAAVMTACQVDLEALTSELSDYIDDGHAPLAGDNGDDPAPTAGFQRVIQRAVIHVQTSGREDVNGANVLIAIFSERESHAAWLLGEQGLTRYDAVNFVAHGITKDGTAAA